MILSPLLWVEMIFNLQSRPPHPCIHQSTSPTTASHKCPPSIVVKVTLGSNGAHAPPPHLCILLLSTVVLLAVTRSSLNWVASGRESIYLMAAAATNLHGVFTIAPPPSPFLAPASPISLKQAIRDLDRGHVGQRSNHLNNRRSTTDPTEVQLYLVDVLSTQGVGDGRRHQAAWVEHGGIHLKNTIAIKLKSSSIF